MAHILLVEDDLLLVETLSELLESKGYRVSSAMSGEDALNLSHENHFDMMLFDVNIPDFSGFELLDLLRKSEDNTPCIFLTSLDDIASLSKGFAAGADDYLKKPFDFDELLIRIEALLRKSFHANSNTLSYKDMSYVIASNELYDVNNRLLALAPQESKLLGLFFKHIDKTLRKEELLFALDSSEASEGALRVYINKLRKIGLEIQTQKGVGYRLVSA